MSVPTFVGREAQLAELNQGAVVAAITGTAGVGKTTLAVHWAHAVQHRFPDGQLFVNLRGFDRQQSALDPGEALLGLLDTLGVAATRIPATTEARAALYRTVLADKRMLVVLDNARDVEQVRPLLPGAPGSSVVVTSRNPLAGLAALESAHPVVLDLLTKAEAVELLTARLGAATMAVHRDAVDRIVVRCAGLPLALAVVAAISAAQPGYSLPAIASDLDSGTLDAFDSTDHMADLRSVFSWSYRLLSADAARMFRLLGLHPGPHFSVTAAANLAGVPVATARRLLLELNEAQFVARHTPGRFSSHDLLRAYAHELAGTLDLAEGRAASSRLLDHYVHSSFAAARLLDPNREPIAVGVCPADVTVVPVSGYDEAMTWFDTEHPVLVGMVDRAGGDARTWKLAWTLSTFLRRRNNGRDWIRTQTAALSAAQQCDDLVGEANAAFSLAMAEFLHGDGDAAYRVLQLAVDRFRTLDDQYGLAGVYHFQCLRYESDGNDTAAFSFAEKAFAHYRLAGHPAGQGRALGAMGWLQTKQGNLREGLGYCRAGLVLSQESGDVMGEAEAWDSIGDIHRRLSEFDRARDAYLRAIGLFRNLADRYNLVHPLIGLGDAHHARGDVGPGATAWREALAIAIEVGHPELEQVQDRLT